MTQSRTYSIGDLAREFDVTTRTIRFYEDEGLLAPQRIGQKRIYRPADRVKLKLILRGKRLGFSLAESRELIEMYNPDANAAQLEALLARIHERRQQLEQQLHDIKVLKLELDEAEQRCRDAMGALEDANTAHHPASDTNQNTAHRNQDKTGARS